MGIYNLVCIVLLATYSLAVQPIHMRDIQVLSFYKDGFTGTLRGQSIPQMLLQTSNVPDSAIPEEIVCKNMGWDGLNVHWDCKADMKESWNMVRPSISCEGWSGPGDEYVVPGSCAISYEMEYHEVVKKEDPPVYEKTERARKTDRDSYRKHTYESSFRYKNDRESYSNKRYAKSYRENLEETRDKINFLLLINDIIENGLEAVLGFSLFGLIIITIIIIGCCVGCRGNSREKEGKTSEEENKENIDSDEDVVEKHVHAISYSR